MRSALHGARKPPAGEPTTRGLINCLSSLRPRILFNTAIAAAAAKSPVPTRPMCRLLFSGLLLIGIDEVQVPMQMILNRTANVHPGRTVMGLIRDAA